jgi:hypothetical protein
MELEIPRQRRRDPRGRVLLLGLAILLAALAASCPLGLLAVRQGLLRPPVFAISLGPHELAAPCPPQMPCDSSVPYYALWHGQHSPGGSVNYRLLYFAYLPPVRR